MNQVIWEQFLDIVREEAGSRVVETWLKAVTLQQWDAQEKVVYVHAPNVFVKDWIKTHYLNLFNEHLSRLFNVDQVKVYFINGKTPEESDQQAPVSIKTEIIPAQRAKRCSKYALVKRVSKGQSYINSNHVFDTFVVGPNNSLAYAAAHAITEKLGSLYNPLFMYGGSGLGKTHLLHAIGNEIKTRYSNVQVLYQTADRFVNEFIHAIRFDKMHIFQKKYKNIDVLLIDDVQFISNKVQTQEAFFHIFNALYEANKQLVFSSDSYPTDIEGIAVRLRSRLAWGLVTDVQAPLLETKIAILKKKSEMNNEQLADDVAHFIASTSPSNIRELEGALIRVTAFASLTKQPVTLELAQKVLQRVVNTSVGLVDFQRIIKVVQKQYSYSLVDLRSQKRNKQLSLARQIAMYLMKKLTNKSLQEIGKFLGRKDHTTVLYALKKVKGLQETNAVFKHQVQRLKEIIIGNSLYQ